MDRQYKAPACKGKTYTFPVNVGEEVYTMHDEGNYGAIVYKIVIDLDGIMYYGSLWNADSVTFRKDDIGNTVFLSADEYAEALKKMRESAE